MTTSKGERSRRLSAKRERFCQHYHVHGNATRAAEEAGYSRRTAKSQGQRLLTFVDVQERLAALARSVSERLGLEAEQVVREAMLIAFSDLGQLVQWGPHGVLLKDSTELPPGLTRCVAEVSESVTEAGGTKKIKLHSKTDALDKLFRHLGLYTDKLDLTSGGKAIEKQVVVIGGQKIEF